MRKAQTSLEYLIILAVVVVLALVTVVALGDAPLLAERSVGRTSQAYWEGSDIAITAYVIQADGDAEFVIKNNLKNEIQVNSMEIGGNSVSGAANRRLAIGEKRTVTGTVGTCTAGDSFSLSVEFNYTDITNNLGPYAFTGLENLKGRCQAA